MLLQSLIVTLFSIQINCELKEYRRIFKHYKCLNDYYPGTDKKIVRHNIAYNEIKWTELPFNPPYDPKSYTAKVVLEGPDWADPDMNAVWFQVKPQWNLNNGQSYNRQCPSHPYLVNGSYPLNPVGRTGLRGRGLLGRWGPNHAVHAVIARYKRDNQDNIVFDNKTLLPCIQFLSVLRADAKLWSVPGRFLRSRERIGVAIKKCIAEEAFNNFITYPFAQRRNILTKLSRLLLNGSLVYLGYVDDLRNTDNAWVSSSVFLYFDKNDNYTRCFDFQPGNNILGVKWIDAHEVFRMEFYGNHENFVEDACRYLDAYYPYDEETLKTTTELNMDVRDIKPSGNFNSIEDETPGNSAKRRAFYSSSLPFSEEEGK